MSDHVVREERKNSRPNLEEALQVVPDRYLAVKSVRTLHLGNTNSTLGDDITALLALLTHQ
jgi:hypothetical protein